LTALAHWNRVYEEKRPDEVSWFEDSAVDSLELIEEAGLGREAALIDVGGGESRLAGELLDRGYSDVTVADISPRALAVARAELGDRARQIVWVEADLREHDFGRTFALWHDRATFHFMVEQSEREAYLRTLRSALAPDGQVVISGFGPEGPTTCSGLPVQRYGAEELAELLPDFELASSRTRRHHTPSNKEQQFVYARFVRSDSATGKPASRQA
jgi:SAM-dependent methyltransferase